MKGSAMLATWVALCGSGALATPEPALLVTEPAELVALEDAGLSAGQVAFGVPGVHTPANAALASSSAYQDLVRTLRGDLHELYAKDKAWGPGMRFTHRGFDVDWLLSPDTRWELAAVVNRADRRVFHPGTCGEVRLVYRLAYTTTTRSGLFSSRLPATLNVVFFLPAEASSTNGPPCDLAVARFASPLETWLVPALRGGPRQLVLKAVELNVQTARWPSTVRPDLGGHADYVLRVFVRDGEGSAAHLKPSPLEATPDVARLKRSPALRGALAAWIVSHVDDVDRGVAVVPDQFLAQRALSATPRGLARGANRPWSQLFTAADLKGLDLSGATTVKDASSLLRRLDGLTCMGCHQSRSLAGFHIVGAERDPTRTVDALAVAVSPHLEDELPRRRAWMAAVSAHAVPDDRRPPAERGQGGAAGAFGDACGLTPSFSSWACASGFTCQPVDDDEVGQCAPVAPAVGGACHPGQVDFVKDRIATADTTACPASAVCEGVGVGFPGGMCAGPCDDGPGGVSASGHSACGGIAILTPFNACLARGELFSVCARHSRPATLRACGPGDPCRPDYLCAKNGEPGVGVCLPPYFVLQMRVDGHPRLKPAR